MEILAGLFAYWIVERITKTKSKIKGAIACIVTLFVVAFLKDFIINVIN